MLEFQIKEKKIYIYDSDKKRTVTYLPILQVSVVITISFICELNSSKKFIAYFQIQSETHHYNHISFYKETQVTQL